MSLCPWVPRSYDLFAFLPPSPDGGSARCSSCLRPAWPVCGGAGSCRPPLRGSRGLPPPVSSALVSFPLHVTPLTAATLLSPRNPPPPSPAPNTHTQELPPARCPWAQGHDVVRSRVPSHVHLACPGHAKSQHPMRRWQLPRPERRERVWGPVRVPRGARGYDRASLTGRRLGTGFPWRGVTGQLVCWRDERGGRRAEAGSGFTGPVGVVREGPRNTPAGTAKAEARGLWPQSWEWGGADRRENCGRGWDHRTCGFAGCEGVGWEKERHCGWPCLSLWSPRSPRPGQESVDRVSDGSGAGGVSLRPCTWDLSRSLGASAAHTGVSQFCSPRPGPRPGTLEPGEGPPPGSRHHLAGPSPGASGVGAL